MAISRQSPIILYLIIVLGFVLGFLYNSQTDPASSAPAVLAKFQTTSLKGLDTLRIDYSILEQPQFRELKIFGQLPVQASGGGTSDPFQR